MLTRISFFVGEGIVAVQVLIFGVGCYLLLAFSINPPARCRCLTAQERLPSAELQNVIGRLMVSSL
jgi:hypothetical protein